MKKLLIAASAIGIALGAISTLAVNRHRDSVNMVSMPVSSDHNGAPPRTYRGDTKTVVRFSSNVAADCQAAGLVGYPGQTDACALVYADRVELIVPNPCRQTGNYAKTICHELGHVNGWRH